MRGFRFNEQYLSQIPALLELVNLGYKYLTPEQAFHPSPLPISRLRQEMGEGVASRSLILALPVQ